MGVYDALKEKGFRIPEDVSVVGFDNQELLAAHSRLPLTTVRKTVDLRFPYDRQWRRVFRTFLALSQARFR